MRNSMMEYIKAVNFGALKKLMRAMRRRGAFKNERRGFDDRTERFFERKENGVLGQLAAVF
jgi:hypothetical protein